MVKKGLTRCEALPLSERISLGVLTLKKNSIKASATYILFNSLRGRGSAGNLVVNSIKVKIHL